MHNIINKCNHSNIVKSIGIWKDPTDESKSYIVLALVDRTLSSLQKEQLFRVENDSLCCLSEFGLKVFRYVQNLSTHITYYHCFALLSEI